MKMRDLKLSKRTKEKVAFTLAEVLITLGIIGVVAAITLPALITNIQDRVKAKRVQNIQQKFSKATDKMLSVSGLNGYGSTMEFVNELKNHLAIAKVCENNDLRSCWPTEKVIIDGDGTEWEIAKTKTGKTLKMTDNPDAETPTEWDDTVGIITGDGTAMILSYNKLCDIDPVKSSTWASDKSSSTSCVAAVFDWNGSNKPNKFGKIENGKVALNADVLTLNANGLGQTCVLEINGSCFGALQPTPNYLTKAQCEEKKGQLGISGCYYDTDYWAWAVDQCGHVNKMASMEDLVAIASKIYNNPNMTGWQTDYDKLTYDSSVAESLGFNSSPGFWVWSGREYRSNNAYYRHFGSSYSLWNGYDRYHSNGLFLCKGD